MVIFNVWQERPLFIITTCFPRHIVWNSIQLETAELEAYNNKTMIKKLKKCLCQFYFIVLGLGFILISTRLLTAKWNEKVTITFVIDPDKEKPVIDGDKKKPDKPVFDDSWPDDGTHKAILLSYMRAGTTFVGSTFEKNKDIFYVFEPEWDLIFNSLNEYKSLYYVDGSVRDPVWINDGKAVVQELIQNYLHCNISGIDLQSLWQRFMLQGQYTKPLHKCMRGKSNKIDCVQNFTKTCQSKNVRFLKTVRLRMSIVEDLLRKDPTLRVIHMIRDPRGIAISRIGWGEFYAAKNTFTFGGVCSEILHDILSLERMPPELSRRVLPVLYEDVAENPIAMIETLYDFLQLPIPEYIRAHVKNITHAKQDIRVGFATQRKSSSKTAYSWRSKIKYNLCKEMDRICSRVYTKIGYLPVKSEKHLRNLNISLRDPQGTNNYINTFGKVRRTAS